MQGYRAAYQELRRLPELFCGFIRKPHRGPTAYPVACAPQAWASAAPFAFLEACLGMDLRHDANSVSFRDPGMPAFLDYVTLNQLSLGKSRLDLRLHRHGREPISFKMKAAIRSRPTLSSVYLEMDEITRWGRRSWQISASPACGS
jgi:hypothetical protein